MRKNILQRVSGAVIAVGMLVPGCRPAWGAGQTPSDKVVIQSVHQTATAVDVDFAKGVLRITPCLPNVARVTYAPGTTIPQLATPYLLHPNCGAVDFHMQQDGNAINITMPELKVTVNR